MSFNIDRSTGCVGRMLGIAGALDETADGRINGAAVPFDVIDPARKVLKARISFCIFLFRSAYSAEIKTFRNPPELKSAANE